MKEEKQLFDQELWESIYPRIYHYALLHVHFKNLSEELAKDFVQDAITLFITGKRKWDPEKIELLPFLKGVIKSLVSHYINAAYQKRRTVKTKSQDEESIDITESVQSKEPTSQQKLERKEFENFLLNEVKDDEDMQFVLLCLFDEKSRSEIAKELDFPLNKVDNLLKRIRRVTIKYFNKNK